METGLDVSNEDFALDVIADADAGGQFLTHKHTFEKCREALYSPRISKRGQLCGTDHHAELLFSVEAEKKAFNGRL